jgi:hypothetical protein
VSRYEVVDTGRVIGADTQVYSVSRNGEQLCNVWRTPDGICRCTQCSGPLTAMSASCAHAKAVRRVVGARLDEKVANG